DFTNQASDGSPLFTLPQISPGGVGTVQPGDEAFFDGTDPNLKDPRVYQWSFTIERELGRGNILRASYISSNTTGLPVRVNLDKARPSALPLTRSRLPYPQFSYVYSFDNLSFSNFQGLQLEASHRFRSDFFFQASYMLAKNLGLTNGNTGTFPQ